MRLQHYATSAFFSLFYIYNSFIAESHALDTPTVINISPTLQNAAVAPTVDRSLVSYSIELMAVTGFTENNFAKNIYNVWFEKTGGRPSIRLGGSGMDLSTFVPNQKEAMVTHDKPTRRWDFGPSFFAPISNYFTKDTEIRFGLNLANTTDNWRNTIDFAVAAKKGIPQLSMFEIGNEVDNFVRNKLRKEPWGIPEYAQQWRKVADMLKAKIPGVRFQAAVYAGTSPNGFNVGGLSKAGVNNNNYKIPIYSVHFYPQSRCAGGMARVRLDNLADNNLLKAQLANYDADIAAAVAAGGRFSFAEANSVSCSGAPGVSDTFGAALWLVNYALAAAAKSVERVYIHSTLTTAYSMFIPTPGGQTPTGVRPMVYGMYFLAEALALPERGSDTKFLVTPISIPNNEGDISVYGLYTNRVQKPNPKAAAAAPVFKKNVVQVVVSTRRFTKSMVYPAGVQTIAVDEVRKVPKSVTTISTVITTRLVKSVTRTIRVPRTTTVVQTRTRVESRGAAASTIYETVSQPTTAIVRSVVTRRATSTQTISTTIKLTIFEEKRMKVTKTVKLTAASTTTWISRRLVTMTTTVVGGGKPIATPPARGVFPTGDGIYLARAVILNLSRFNTSDPNGLNCRSCRSPSPPGFGTSGSRPSKAIRLSGFQPGHKLKLLRLQAPGLNAKSGATVSGLKFNDDTGIIATQATPESVTVDAAGEVKFNVQATEGVLLVDEAVK
ncbi:hypothetical protein TWF696_004980 [Orbilia brochopaga]|uniref:Beta-glucuronidase C-terminal domain-containing protein n=1 Tax=Orbilia brochopaga TaxID=3140254 RepID=A0AAV9V1N6_9PEZI